MTTSKFLKWNKFFAALFLSVHFTATNAIVAPDLVGSYCASRTNAATNGCCGGRRDHCSVPILGTLCYCDDFCNRTRNEDCCPDYFSHCRGIIEPPETTSACVDQQGRLYKYGEVAQINCNQCKCEEVNGTLEFLCEKNVCLIDEELLQRVNGDYRSYGWRASNYSAFWSRKHDEGVALRLGTLHSRKKVLEMEPIKDVIDFSKLPRSFDSRTAWPGSISLPRDQGWCGASWVFSTISVVSDRFTISTHGSDRPYLSPQHLLNCNSRNQRGCQGGHLTRAWMFIRKFGLVPESCYPWEGVLTECRVLKRKKSTEENCPVEITFGRLKGELHRVGPVYRVATEDGIKHEIMKNGPVQAVMKVSRDFFSYQSGIYRCSSLSAFDRSGYHAVRIIGWGEELQNNQLIKYWIVSNSWGQWWGENGFFRIRRGSNECLIEEFVIAAWPKIDNFNTIYDTAKFARNNLAY